MLRFRAVRFPFAVLGTCAALCAQAATAVVHGTVHPAHLLRVKARADGQVARVFVAVGDEVGPLAPLVTLSAPEVRAEADLRDVLVQAAEMHVQVLAAEEKKLQLQQAAAERAAAAARDAVLAARSRVEVQEQATRGKETLMEAGRASAEEVAGERQRLLDLQRELQDREAAAAAAADGVELAKLDLLRAGHAAAEHRLRIGALRGERDVWQARAQLLEVKSVLQHARVSRVLAGTGDVVRAGVTDLVELVDASTVTVELHLPEALAHRVAAATKVYLIAPGEDAGAPGLPAAVARTSGVVDAGVTSAFVDVDNKDGRWLPGQELRVRVELQP